MDSIFGRKKKSRQIGDILTSSGGTSQDAAEVVGNSLPGRYTAQGNGIRSQAYSQHHDTPYYGDEFNPKAQSSMTHTSGYQRSSHARNPSSISSSMQRNLPTDYSRASIDRGNGGRSIPARGYSVSSDAASQQGYAPTRSSIVHRMSTSSASSSAAGISAPWSTPDNQNEYVPYPYQSGSSAPRDSSLSSAMARLSTSTVSQPSNDKAEFAMARPSDAEIEEMFAELMNKRDFLGLPGSGPSDEYKEAARRNMMDFPIHKKWMLVYNDKFTEFHAEKEKERSRRVATMSQSGPKPLSNLIITRNSPEWYIKKFMDGSVTTKHIESLAVTLRTCAMGWVENFVDAKGTPVLASFLNGLHTKGVKSDTDVALEYETLKAFRSLFNSKAGANDALGQPKCVNSIVHSVTSSHLATRKQAADILLFLCHWAIPSGHRLVLRGFDELKTALGDHGRFDAWFRVFEQTIDGRGQMGSRVGASEEIRKLTMMGHQEASLNEYAVNNMFLVNAILSSRIVAEYEIRVHLRNQMEASGLQRILIKLRAFKNSDLDRQIDEFDKAAEADHDNIVANFNRDILTDMNDPVDVFKAIVGKVSGSRAYDFFLSALQHFLLIKQEGDGLVHYYQLIDSMVTAVVMDRKGSVEGNDLSSLLGVSVNNVLSRFADQDAMQATKDELVQVRLEARLAQQDRARMEAQMKQSSGGLVGSLQEQVQQLENDLDVARGNASAMQRDMEEMEKGYVDRIVALEVQSRELYAMLKGAHGTAEMLASDSGSLNRQQLVDTLEKQMERNKTIRKLEANARKEGRLAQLTNEEKIEEVREREKRRSRKRLSRKSMHGLQSSFDEHSRSIDGKEEEGDDTLSASDSEEIDPSTEAGKWKIQATLAAGMAANADLQSRMTDAKDSRRRKQREVQASEAVSIDSDAPPAPPPPPMPASSGGGGNTFLDEIRRRRNESQQSSDVDDIDAGSMEPPPAPPPPPPAPPLPPDAPPLDMPPPPPMPPGLNLQTPQNRHSMAHFANGSIEGTPTTNNRDSMLNVRTSYHGDLGPSGPAHAPPAPPHMANNFATNMVMRKEVLETAKTRTKQLQWDKLTPQHAAETVWAKSIVEESQMTAILKQRGLFDEMEEDFKAKQITKRNLSNTAKKDKTEFKTHLTLQTRQGIEMVLRRVKSSLTEAKHATPEEVAHHIVNCNDAVLDQSFLTELLRHYPESETKGQLGEYRNASDEELRLLHPADRLVVLLMTVPHLKDKVKGLLYFSKYRESVEVIKQGTAKIREGSEALMKAQNFAKLLNLILMMGNYLNSTGMQGGAFGFKISSINKLVDTKAGDGTTLLHFIERSIEKCFPDVEVFLDELEKPNEACRVQMLDLKRDLAELKSGSLQHRKELDRFVDESEDRLEDPYTKLMLPFLNEVHGELVRLSDQMQLCERTYVDALKYFGEGPDPKRRGFPAAQLMRTEDFFGIFREFCTAYRKIKIDNIKIAELRAAEAKRRAAAEEREKERQEAAKRKEAGVDDSAVLETLLGNLRSGANAPKRKRKTDRRIASGRDSGRGSVGAADKGDAEGSGAPAVTTTAPANSIDGNPSDVAQAMLAKLQGGDGLAPQREGPSAPYSTRRRRERRVTGPHRGSLSADGPEEATITSTSASAEALTSGHARNSTGESTQSTFSQPVTSQSEEFVDTEPSFAPLHENVGLVNSPTRIAATVRPSSGTSDRFTDAESEQLHSSPARTYLVESKSNHADRTLPETTFSSMSSVYSGALAGHEGQELQLPDQEVSPADHAADTSIGDHSGGFQGDWFDPDSSGFIEASADSADRTARPT